MFPNEGGQKHLVWNTKDQWGSKEKDGFTCKRTREEISSLSQPCTARVITAQCGRKSISHQRGVQSYISYETCCCRLSVSDMYRLRNNSNRNIPLVPVCVR